jgi:hypothetical protein
LHLGGAPGDQPPDGDRGIGKEERRENEQAAAGNEQP